MIKDGWRLEYANFRDVPIAQWPARAAELQARAVTRRAELPISVEKDHPAYNEIKNLDALIADVPEGCIRYPLEDATATLEVWQGQEKHAEPYLRDQYRQAYADFVLYLSSVWGLRTDAAGVSALRAELEEAHGELAEELQALGLVRAICLRELRRPKALMIHTCAANGVTVRRTDAQAKCELGDACEEHISLDSDACEAAVAAKDGTDEWSTLAKYSEFVTLGKMLSNDVKMLGEARDRPTPVHTL